MNDYLLLANTCERLQIIGYYLWKLPDSRLQATTLLLVVSPKGEPVPPYTIITPLTVHIINNTVTRQATQKKFFFLASGVGFPLSPLRFSTLLTKDPAAHQNHCGRCWIRTQDLCPRSLVRYQWTTTFPYEPPHLEKMHTVVNAIIPTWVMSTSINYKDAKAAWKMYRENGSFWPRGCAGYCFRHSVCTHNP